MRRSMFLWMVLAGMVICAVGAVGVDGGSDDKGTDAVAAKEDGGAGDAVQEDDGGVDVGTGPRLFFPYSKMTRLTVEQRVQIAGIHKQTLEKIKLLEAEEAQEIEKLLNELQKKEMAEVVEAKKAADRERTRLYYLKKKEAEEKAKAEEEAKAAERAGQIKNDDATAVQKRGG